MGKEAHQLVCQLAFETLPPTAQQQINKIVSNVPSKERYRINRYLQREDNAPIRFTHLCNWADAIKGDNSFQRYNSWHYANMPRRAITINDMYCQQKKFCLISAIEFHLGQLASTSMPHKRWQPLAFLGHWLGDLHQPLHLGFYDDRGGNRIPINSKLDNCRNLHALWDYCLLALLTKVDFAVIYLSLALDVTSAEKIDISAWAFETAQLTRATNIGYCTMKQNVCHPPLTAVLFNSQYLNDNKTLYIQQLIRAAKRLNGVLQRHL
ncbi:S1/P1 nuclease [Thalassotalea maritima]|uniref:S1/P1 nuclease n=1 Tax=Thalassotalea maritima TaxID=3242416 RepID=UPI0035297F08